jgi:L-seryl-tRNA(Ser) seleniumtransferase
LDHLVEVAGAYSNVELDLESGDRSRRDVHAESILLRTLAVKAGRSTDSTHPPRRAVVVNNCAAATFLALNSLADGAEVIVSRGELVEIGGGFRIPDILRKSGAILREVGTTNKTRLSDYQSAISERTALILRVHQSNFRMEGFTDRPSLEELVATAAKAEVPIFEDQGTGLLMSVDSIEATDDSSLVESFRAAPDLIAASGDKLLGGPQCGMLVGRPELIERIVANPLMRTFRVCKLTYAALEGTLVEYLAGNLKSIPVSRMLTLSSEEVLQRCRSIAAGCTTEGLSVDVIPTDSVIGGGTTPGATLKSFAVAVRHKNMSSTELARLLRGSNPPVVARIKQETVLLDLRTVPPESDDNLLSILNAIRVEQERGEG